MPVIILYFIKVSICLAVVFLFYRLLLQQLTFYNLNRWYLLGYSLLAFVIPLINISPVVEEGQWSDVEVIQSIPVIHDYTPTAKTIVAPVASIQWNIWDVLLLALLTGFIVMFIRLVLQWLSLIRLMRNARLVSSDSFNLYEVKEKIIPFSIGKSVFVNPSLHQADEMQEILQHEYVHVQQKHSIDIVFAEILCLFNWFNPFAWLIRHRIRQNLEFIADKIVLQNGVAKKQYQYTLLKVMGYRQFSMGASFNYSSLKKRIVMMNKIKTAKLHLVKFLFLVPLLAVLLLAFRISTKKDEVTSQSKKLSVYGLVIDAVTDQPLANVRFKDAISKVEGATDDKGYFALSISVTNLPYKTHITFSKEGYHNSELKTQISSQRKPGDPVMVDYIGMRTLNNPDAMGYIHGGKVPKDPNVKPDFDFVLKNFDDIKASRSESATVKKMTEGSEKLYWVINSKTYLLTKGGSASMDTIVNIVMVNGKKMTGDQVNEKFTRSMLNNIDRIGAIGKEHALKKYGINEDVMEIITVKPAPPRKS